MKNRWVFNCGFERKQCFNGYLKVKPIGLNLVVEFEIQYQVNEQTYEKLPHQNVKSITKFHLENQDEENFDKNKKY